MTVSVTIHSHCKEQDAMKVNGDSEAVSHLHCFKNVFLWFIVMQL